MTAEDLQGRRHVRHLVAAADLDPGLQVAAGHAAHPVREHLEAAQDDATDEEPRDEQGSSDADCGDRQQQGAAGEDGLGGSLRGPLGAGAGRAHERVDLADEVERDAPVEGEQGLLVLDEVQPVLE